MLQTRINEINLASSQSTAREAKNENVTFSIKAITRKKKTFRTISAEMY